MCLSSEAEQGRAALILGVGRVFLRLKVFFTHQHPVQMICIGCKLADRRAVGVAVERNHRNAFVDYIDEQISQEKQLSILDLLQKRELDIEPERITFRFVEEPLVTVLGRAAPDLMILVLEIVLFFILAHVAFQRYDIR